MQPGTVADVPWPSRVAKPKKAQDPLAGPAAESEKVADKSVEPTESVEAPKDPFETASEPTVRTEVSEFPPRRRSRPE